MKFVTLTLSEKPDASSLVLPPKVYAILACGSLATI